MSGLFHSYNIMGIIVALTAVAVLFGFIYQIFHIFSGGGTPLNRFKLMKGLLPKTFRKTLEKHFQFYIRLSAKDKDKFERRIWNFMANKYFIPMHTLGEVTDEMKTLISASAVQLTFGLKDVYFVHFDRILVFPTKYFSKITGEDHVGEVNSSGFICFSWKAFVEGYIDHDDTYNVGLHEMAHALSLENGIKNQEYGFLNPEYLRRWKILADAEFEKMKMGNYDTFLRRYAFSNRDEFFPVCVEHFFEKPIEFKEKSPHLYKALSNLLNQDPAKWIDINSMNESS